MKDLSLHLLDIIQNSISARANSIDIRITADIMADKLSITVEDTGVGMEKEVLEQITNPFTTSRTTRKVGLGIPLFKASARMAEGELKVDSVKGFGTILEANFRISHIDRLPLGDIAGTITFLIVSEPEIRCRVFFSNMREDFVFDSFEIKKKLDGVPITRHEVLNWIREYIDEGIKAIFGGVLNEVDS